MRRLAAAALAVLLAGPASAADEIVRVLDDTPVELDPQREGPSGRGYTVRDAGRTLERTVELPPPPDDQRDARRITVTVTVEPVIVPGDGQPRPADVWTRLGSVGVLVEREGGPVEVELMRFTTGFGGAGSFSQDVTALAPLLSGRRTLRLSLSTYRKPAWRVGLALSYDAGGVGYRRPVYARPLFNEAAVTWDRARLEADLEIPPGLARPRLRIISTGHATGGGPRHEFVTCTHVLRIDGREVARWRPWSEGGGALRDRNPWAGRRVIDGREVWSSDLDRSGWLPGAVVEPLVLPVPELTPGPHRVELAVLGLRPPGDDGAFGYWRISVAAIADEPWAEP